MLKDGNQIEEAYPRNVAATFHVLESSRVQSPSCLSSPTVPRIKNTLSKSRGSLRAEQLLAADLANAVGQGEAKIFREELLDVGALDIIALLEFDDAENLDARFSKLLGQLQFGSQVRKVGDIRTWIDLKRARWRAAMSE